MRIALLAPDPAAPWGSRLAAELAARGHSVTLACPPGSGGAAEASEGVALVHPAGPPRLPVARFYEDGLELAPAVIWRLVRGRFDLVHAFAPAFGWAAAQARRFGGPPFAYTFAGQLTREWLVERHYRLEMMLATAAVALACFVEDEATAGAFRRYLLRDPEVLAPGADAGVYEAAYSGAASA
jgi:hypothetical protein